MNGQSDVDATSSSSSIMKFDNESKSNPTKISLSSRASSDDTTLINSLKRPNRLSRNVSVDSHNRENNVNTEIESLVPNINDANTNMNDLKNPIILSKLPKFSSSIRTINQLTKQPDALSTCLSASESDEDSDTLLELSKPPVSEPCMQTITVDEMVDIYSNETETKTPSKEIINNICEKDKSTKLIYNSKDDDQSLECSLVKKKWRKKKEVRASIFHP